MVPSSGRVLLVGRAELPQFSQERVSTMSEYAQLAAAIQRLDFDTVFTVEDGAVVEQRNVYAPTVMHDPVNDVEIDDPRWSCVTGMTGQYAYHGAVMHPSEYVGEGVARRLAEEYDAGTLFALVVVSAYPEDDGDESEDVGWAVAYREGGQR